MKPQFPSYLRYGLIAIGLAATATCGPAAAGPSGYLATPTAVADAASSSPEVIQVQSRRIMRGARGGWAGRGLAGRGLAGRGLAGRRLAGRSLAGRNLAARSGARYRNWSGRRWYGRDYDYDDYWDNWWPGYSTGLLFSFGLPAYGYYDPYRYGTSRRVYRTYALSADHVAWCYDRWRSYREADNSYQPYNGPRRRCRSPYG